MEKLSLQATFSDIMRMVYYYQWVFISVPLHFNVALSHDFSVYVNLMQTEKDILEATLFVQQCHVNACQ